MNLTVFLMVKSWFSGLKTRQEKVFGLLYPLIID